MQSLSELQSWMQHFITAAELDAETSEAASRLVLPSNTLAAEERVGIYRGMYLPRLIEALETDYPGVLCYLGREGFDKAAEMYLRNCPSTSYTLNRLGDRFPKFLMSFAGQLARLELAMTQVFDEEECSVLTASHVAAIPDQAWESAILQPIQALRIMAFGYGVSEYLDRVQSGENPVEILKKRTYVAVYRRDFNVHRLTLPYPAFKLLRSLTAGTPVAQAVAGSGLGEERIFQAFREWTAAGLFRSIQLQ